MTANIYGSAVTLITPFPMHQDPNQHWQTSIYTQPKGFQQVHNGYYSDSHVPKDSSAAPCTPEPLWTPKMQCKPRYTRTQPRPQKGKVLGLSSAHDFLPNRYAKLI